MAKEPQNDLDGLINVRTYAVNDGSVREELEGGLRCAECALLSGGGLKATVISISPHTNAIRSIEPPKSSRPSAIPAETWLISPLVSSGPPGNSASPATLTAKCALSTIYPSIEASESLQMTLEHSNLPASTSSTSLKGSSLALSSILPSVATAALQTGRSVAPSLGSAGDVADLGQLGPESESVRVSSHVGVIISGILAGAIVVATLITVYFYRRAKRRSNRRSTGGVGDTAPFFMPWKKRESDLHNTITNLEGLLEQQDNSREPKNQTDFASYLHDGEGAKTRRLIVPEPSFAPLRAHRSSSLYSGSILNGFPINYFTPRARSALFPPMRAGLRNSSIERWLSHIEQRKDQMLPYGPQPLSNIYIARPYSVSDIVNSFDEKARHSALSSIHSSSVISSNYADQRKDLGHSPVSKNTSSTTTTKVDQALVTVRDLDTGVRLNLDTEQELGFRTIDVAQTNPVEHDDLGVRGSKPRSGIAMNVGKRETGKYDNERGGLEDWEERGIERRRKEEDKARSYTGRIRPGMGVQKSSRGWVERGSKG